MARARARTVTGRGMWGVRGQLWMPYIAKAYAEEGAVGMGEGALAAMPALVMPS